LRDELRAVLREELLTLGQGQSLGQSLGTPVPHAEKATRKTERQLALDWLRDHPEHRDKPGRWLQDNVQPDGVTISYRTWNRAKKGE
jgi:hypothetical protein